MQSCHAVGIMVSVSCGSGKPTSPDPLLPCHQIFGFALIRLPCCCLHSSPSCSSLHRPLFTFREQLQVLKQRTGFFAVCPPQPFQLFPTPTRCPAVLALWGSFLTPVCLYILVPLSQSQGAVPQDTEGRWRMGPAIPSCSSRGRPCPLSSPSPQWVHLTIYESPHLSFNLSQHQGIFQ